MNPHMTAADNMAFGLRVMGSDKQTITLRLQPEQCHLFNAAGDAFRRTVELST